MSKPKQISLFGGIDASFQKFHADNPQVYVLLVNLCRMAKENGRKQLGISMIFERLRWYSMVDTKGDEYKLNNNFRSRYARLIMQQEPDLAGFFNLRDLRS